jgi:hypothetical protein
MARFAFASVAATVLTSGAFATVSSTLTADTYIVKDGSGASAKFYSVLDIYVKGNKLGDTFGSISGLNGTNGQAVVFATNKATGTGLTRDANGKITAGTITNDVFVQAGNSTWNPNYTGAGSAWDSFVALGNRTQMAQVINRASTLKDYGAPGNFGGSSDFSQFGTANSSYINNGGGVAWYSTLGANPYSSAGASEVPFARVSVYSSNWQSVYNYTTLDKTGDVTILKGKMQNGRTTAGGSATFSAAATGSTIDSTNNYFYMIGRFAIDVTQSDPNTPLTEVITMNAQFNMVGKNGTGNEAGTTFTGATTASYKVSQFFTFAIPAPGAAALVGMAGLITRRRHA